ncbi:MAG: alginate lyase family protein [Fibrobacteria bacterium]
MGASPGVLLHTLGHLRLRQVGYRILRRLRKDTGVPLPLEWRRLESRLRRLSNTGRIYFDGTNGFNFNNESRNFTGDWNDPGARKLWRYNLHYMAWLVDADEGDREGWVDRWIDGNPPYRGDGWEPYPLSLRLFNWCKLYTVSDMDPSGKALESMRRQGGCLLANLEFHIDGNHLLENLLALKYLGFFLDSRDRTARRASEAIDSRLAEALQDQFLADGGHYELSPMYHAIVLERMLDLLNVWPAGHSPVLRTAMDRLARLGLDWLDTMSVSGRFALFNDSCYDGAPEAAQLLEFGSRLLQREPLQTVPLRELPDSGYFRVENGPFTVLFDGGGLGPDHQLGHAQGDMLSFCLWVRGTPVLVHPGNYEYLSGPMRDYCRSTVAHNTVSLQGMEQAEWWASHRVGRRGRAKEVSAVYDSAAQSARLSGSHTGFLRPPARTVHRRTLDIGRESIAISDDLSPSTPLTAAARFHFHPDCRVRLEGDAAIVSAGECVIRLSSDLPIRLEEGWHCPEFGLRLPSPVAVVAFAGAACKCVLHIVEPGG